MTITDWLTQNTGLLTALVGFITIAAIIFAPIIALRVQTNIEENKERKKRKLFIFKTLMATRAARVSPDHVQALNMIDIEFYGIKQVIEPWKLYQDHLNSPSAEPLNESIAQNWVEKGEELLIDLLYKMAEEVSYSFDKVTLKRGIYSPRAHGELEWQFKSIREGVLAVIDGKKSISMEIKSFPIVEDIQKNHIKLQNSLIEYLDGKRTVKVNIEEKNENSQN